MTPRTPGPAYANLQRRKPREGIRQTVRRALSKMVSRVISIRSREFSKNLGFEYVYNFGVMAEGRRMSNAVLRRPVVLVVEDEFLIRISAVEIIEDAGFELLQAADADEAIE